MRTRALVVLAVAAFSLATPGIAAPKERTVEARYTEPMRGHPDLFATCIQPDNRGCVEFGVGPKDRKVSIVVSDDSGTAPYFLLRQEIEGGVEDRFFCGTTDGFVPVESDGRITVFVYATTSTSDIGCTGLGSAGTVTATFRR